MREKQLEDQRNFKEIRSNLNVGKEIKEDKVSTEFLSQNNDRVQAFKHVQTQNKPEYTSLEDLQREKENHLRRLKESEAKYETMKNNKHYGTMDGIGKVGSKISLDDLEQTEHSMNLDSIFNINWK